MEGQGEFGRKLLNHIYEVSKALDKKGKTRGITNLDSKHGEDALQVTVLLLHDVSGVPAYVSWSICHVKVLS